MPRSCASTFPSTAARSTSRLPMCPASMAFAIQISQLADNPKLSLPSTNGLMVLLSRTTGLTEALMLDSIISPMCCPAAAGAKRHEISGAPIPPVATISARRHASRIRLKR